MVTACRPSTGQASSAAATAWLNLLGSAIVGQGICITAVTRPLSTCASLRLAPPKSHPKDAVIQPSIARRLFHIVIGSARPGAHCHDASVRSHSYEDYRRLRRHPRARSQGRVSRPCPRRQASPVSYTHLTLPTI